MILLKGHHYKNKNPKTNRYVNNIIPQEDREVHQRMFDCFEDTTGSAKEILNEGDEQ